MIEKRCKHDLTADQCDDCREPPPGLTKRVIITRGGKVFHRITSCAALLDGQRYAARLGQEVHYPVVVALSVAQADGRAVCTCCFPGYRPDQIEALRQLVKSLDAARSAVSAACTTGADRAELTDIVARALIDIRGQVWPNAAPIRMPRPPRASP